MVNIIGLKKACEILCTAAVVISLHAALFIADTIICRLNRISNVFHSAHSWAVISASSVSASTMSWDVEAPRGGFVGTFTMTESKCGVSLASRHRKVHSGEIGGEQTYLIFFHNSTETVNGKKMNMFCLLSLMSK